MALPPIGSTSFEDLLQKHTAHRALSKEYLPLLYGNSEGVTRLELAGSGVTDAAATSIADALRRNTCVVHVDLADNAFSTDGCTSLGAMLSANQSITSLDLHNNAITDEGVAALHRALDTNTTLKSIDISNCTSVSDAAAEELQITVALNSRPDSLKRALRDIRERNVALVDLSYDTDSQFRDFEHNPDTKLDCWAACRLADALSGCTSVRTLRLCNQQIGDVGAIAMATMLIHNQRIDVIDLFCNIITNTGVEALIQCIDTNNIVTVINIKSNCASDAAGHALERKLVLNRQPLFLKKYLPKLRDNDPDVVFLHLDEHNACRYYDDISAKLLSEVLPKNTHLTALDLSNNHLTEVGAHFLSDALKTNTGLKTINFSNNTIGSAGAQHLSEALKCSDTIMCLQLINTGIDDIGGQSLAAAAAESSSLTKLDLSDNPDICESGAHFVKAVQTNQLKELNLKGTRVSKITLRALRDCRAVASEPPALRSIVAKLHRGDAALTTVSLKGKKDEFALKDSSASVLGAILQESYVLTDLDLSWNLITKKGVRPLCDGLLVNKYTLKRLSLAGNNGLDYEAAKMLVEVLEQHMALASLDLSHNHLLDGGGKVLYEFLKNSPTGPLTELDVSHNKMEPALELSLLTLVESHKCLPEVKQFLVEFVEGKIPPGVLNMDLIQNVTDPDINENVFNATAHAVSIALGNSQKFHAISCKGNRLGDKGALHLVELFKRNPALLSLDLSNNRITDVGVIEIINMIEVRPEVRSIAITGVAFVVITNMIR